MAVEKMVEGRLRKYFEDVALMEQKFIVNDSINIKVCALLFELIKAMENFSKKSMIFHRHWWIVYPRRWVLL